MFENLLILLVFTIFVYQKFFCVEVSVKGVSKRKYMLDMFDLADEPLLKRPRMEKIQVMRVYPFSHNQTENIQVDQTENNNSDDESVLSETTVDAFEYFGRNLPQLGLASQQIPQSSENGYVLEDQNSVTSLSSLSTLEFTEENINSFGFRARNTPYPRSEGN